MKKIHYSFLALILAIGFTSCKKDNPEPEPIYGCMDANALNFNPNATHSDGNCQYAEVYLPLTTGNTWTLEDELTLPIIGTVPVTVVYDIDGDTTINGKTWSVGDESIGSTMGGQNTRYAYRQESNTGKVWRMNITSGDTVEKLFFDYPLTIGKTWYDTPAQDGFQSTVVGIGIVTVPAGSFTNVIQLQMIDLSSSATSILYFAKEAGPVKADISMEVPSFGQINIQPELTSYHLN